jgi:radical SAM superfamily enzyme YgiQ (UPF0313 family)
MQRGVQVAQVQTAIRLCKSRNIQTGMFLMWGYEGEEMEDIEATVEHVKTSDPDIFLTTVAYPIKGTPYFEEVASRVVSNGAWAVSSDRDFRVEGRRSKEFYHNADQLLRAEVELHQLLTSAQNSEKSPVANELRERILRARHGMQALFATQEV